MMYVHSSCAFFLCSLIVRPPPSFILFPYTTLFRSPRRPGQGVRGDRGLARRGLGGERGQHAVHLPPARGRDLLRSEEHTSELQSRGHLVCRLLLEKKNE